jgi:hypothetical protein
MSIVYLRKSDVEGDGQCATRPSLEKILSHDWRNKNYRKASAGCKMIKLAGKSD